MRKHQFGKPIRFLEMRIARHDEGIDPERLILLDACRDGLRIADKSGAGPTADEIRDQADQIREDAEQRIDDLTNGEN